MNSATDREPMDSAVRVTVPTQRRNGLPTPASDIEKRAAEEDSEESHRAVKRRRTKTGDRANQMVVVYDATPPQAETELYTRLHKMDTHRTLTQQFRCARHILTGLGHCAADLLWTKILENESIAKTVGRGKIPTAMKELIENWTFDMPNPNPLSSNYNVTPQFTKLIEVLQACETQDDTFRGIIIVKRPIIAIMIVELLKALDDDLAHLRPITVLKSSAIDEILDNFSSGHYNLLVTTEYMEALPHISVAIQYNLFQPSLCHPRPWGQVEAQETLMIYMVEHNNRLHKRLLRTSSASDAGNIAASSARQRILYDSDSDDETDSEAVESIHDPTTGRTIEKTQALSVMRAIFDPSEVPFKSRQDKQGKYIAGVGYPIGHSLRTVEGDGEPSLDEAKESACFRVLGLLHKKGLLPTSLFPPTATSDSGAAAPEASEKAGQAAKASATTRSYPRKLPQFWTNTVHIFKDRLYPLVVSVSSSGDDHHAPILVLTRSWLPDLPDLPVFSNGSRVTVHMERAAPVRLDRSQLQTLQRYTLRITRAVINKPLDLTLETMPYFFAPLESECNFTTTGLFPQPLPSVSIAWDYVETAVSNWAYPLLPDDKKLASHDVQDSIVQDRGVEFTNRYFVVKMRNDITPLSKAEEGEREAAYPSFLEYCKSRRKEFAGLKDENQPLVEVSPVPPSINNLSPLSKCAPSVSKYTAKYLIPELCYKFSIPASVFRTALLLPSIMHAIDSILLIKEVNWNMFSGMFHEERLHAAMVCPTASMQHDYERLELLGDAFLKYAASTYFYTTMPTAREGALHAARQLIISNKALRMGAIEAGLPPYIQSKPVVPKAWKPQIYQTAGEDDDDDSGGNKVKESNLGGSGESKEQDARGSQEDGKVNEPGRRSGGKRKRQQDEYAIQWLGDKTVADVVEAMLGAMYLDEKEDLTLMAAKKLHIPFSDVEHWSDFSAIAPPVSDYCSLPPHVLAAVQKLVGYTFKKPALLAEALTHTSNQFRKSYDRLEFLGDAVLDLLTVEHVFHTNPDLSPGGLSMLKGAMVSNTTLATVCVLSGLHTYLQFSSKDLSIATTICVAKVRTLHDTEHKLAEKEGRLPCQFWMELEPPKALSDIVESVIGAIFVDCGFQTDGVRIFFESTLKPFFDRHIRLQTLSDHPNMTLTELFHAEGCQQHNVAKDADGSTVRYDVLVHGTVLASAADPISNAALRKAAMAALDALADDPGYITRVCDCRTTRRSNKAQKKADKTARDTQTDEDTTMKEAGSDGDEVAERETEMSALDAE